MRLTIVREDNAVIVDGVRFTVDCSSLPVDVHAVQWDGAAGEVEYSVTRCDHCGARQKKGNEFIRDASPYQTYVDAWKLAKAADDAEKVARAAEDAAKLAEGALHAARSQG